MSLPRFNHLGHVGLRLQRPLPLATPRAKGALASRTNMLMWGFLPPQKPDPLPEPSIVEFDKEVPPLTN